LFSIIATVGVALGGSGKLSSLNALNSMGGMMKGWQAGRKDLFAKEQAMFDKELARVKASNDRLMKNLEQYNKLRVTDKEAALLKAQEIASENPGVIAQLIEAGRADVAAQIAGKNSDALIKAAETAAKHGVNGKSLTYESYFPGIKFEGTAFSKRGKTKLYQCWRIVIGYCSRP
jgi:hypothetical protein